GTVERIVVRAQLLEDLGAIRAGVLVALPCVDCVTPSGQPDRLHRLAKGAVRVSLPGSQLEHDARLQCGNGEGCKGNVLMPALNVAQPPRLIEDERIAQR